MISDGYTESVVIDNVPIVYRPLIKVEREALCFLLSGLTEKEADEIFHRTLSERATPYRDAAEWEWWLDDLGGNARETIVRSLLGDPRRQRKEVDNLADSVSLIMHYPHLADVTCQQCRVWWYDPYAGTTAKRGGQVLKRPEGSVLLCETPAGCPKGTYSSPIVPLPKNMLAIKHFRMCEAIGRFPEDMIVARNAEIIRRGMKEKAAC